MLNIKKLNLLRILIDESGDILKDKKIRDKIKNVDNIQSPEILFEEIRNNICDLITLKKAWNKGRRIEEEVGDIYG